MSPYERDVYQQLEDAKRIIAHLLTRDGKDHVRIPLGAFMEISNSAQIVVWQDPVKFEMVVAFRGAYVGEHGPEYIPWPGPPAAAPPADDDVVDAEIVDEPALGTGQRALPSAPPAFRVEPHPHLPGVVRPVLDKPVRIDPATGAVEWEA